MTERKPQINLVVTEDQKQRWERYLNDETDEFRSLSQLIRQAVEKEVNGDPANGAGEISEEVSEQLSELVEGMGRVESRIHDLDNRLATVERDVNEDPDVKKLANEVFGVLPTKQEVLEYEKTGQRAGAAPDSPATAGTVEGIADELGKEQYRVAEALNQLQQDTHQVSTMTLTEEVQGWEEFRGADDETRYYKEG